MRRGDLYWIDFEPIQGAESNKTRPAVVVSNDAGNRSAQRTGRGVVTVVPLTSNTDRVYPFQVLLSADECGLGADSKAQAEQVRAVSVHRFSSRIGRVPRGLMDRIDSALRLHLQL